MTSLLSFNTIAAFFRAMIEAQLKPLPGALGAHSAADAANDDSTGDREVEYLYWGLFPVY